MCCLRGAGRALAAALYAGGAVADEHQLSVAFLISRVFADVALPVALSRSDGAVRQRELVRPSGDWPAGGIHELRHALPASLLRLQAARPLNPAATALDAD